MFGEYFSVSAIPQGVGISSMFFILWMGRKYSLLLMTYQINTPQNEIPIIILKHIPAYVFLPLVDIVNTCLMEGFFQVNWRRHKKGDKQDMTNYRPIPLLSSVAKIFERVIYTRLMKFLNENEILSENQYGFRPNHSRQLAVSKVISFIVINIDKNRKVACLFFDLSKAFDTTDYTILMNILERYGIWANCLNLVRSYLQDRWQTVAILHNGAPCMGSKWSPPRQVSWLSGKCQDAANPSVWCDGKTVPERESVRLLSVHLDPSSWESQIGYLVSNLNGFCALLRRLLELVTLDTLR